MTNLAMWATIVGFLAPPVIAIIQQSRWSNRIRAVVTFGVALVAGAGTAYFQGELTGKRFLEASMIVFVAAIASFYGFWKPTDVAPTIERTTDLGPSE